jgi:iron complex outermembrane receptor protein
MVFQTPSDGPCKPVLQSHFRPLIIATFPRPIQGGEADIYGGEAGVEFLATRWLIGFANYSYQEIGQTFAGQAQRGAPRSKINVGLRGEWDNGFSSEVAYHYYGAVTYPINAAFSAFEPFGVIPTNPRVGSYNLLNLRAGYRFWQQRAAAGYLREAEVAVSAFNALNDRHKEYPLGDTIGSRIMGWLTVKF